MKWKRGVFIGLLILIFLMAIGAGFYFTGGAGLVRLYQNYLKVDLPDKKYSWRDFTDQGPETKLNGYYAGSIGNSVFIWTLSGLKRFTHEPQMSVYYYSDFCAAVRQLAENRAEGKGVDRTELSQLTTFDLTEWREWMRAGYYVALTRVPDRPYVVSQMYGSSNRDYPVANVRSERCEK